MNFLIGMFIFILMLLELIFFSKLFYYFKTIKFIKFYINIINNKINNNFNLKIWKKKI